MSEPAWVPLGPAAVLDVGPEVAYAEFTAAVAITVTSEGASQTVVTAPAFAADGSSQYLVEFFTPLLETPSGSGALLALWLFMDGVSLGMLGQMRNNGASAIQVPARMARRITPAAGSRTFSLRASVSTGTATVYGGVGGVATVLPGHIRVTKVPSAVAGPSGLVPPTAIGTALPASPVDGQEFILTDSLTAPTFTWHLRYMAAKATNKWLFIGGSPIHADVLTSEAATSLSYVALTTAGPSIAVPVAGDYIVSHGMSSWVSAEANGGYMSYDIGGTAAVDTDKVGFQSGRNVLSNHARARKRTLTAITLVAKYRAVTAGTANFQDRWMELLPIAIGG